MDALQNEIEATLEELRQLGVLILSMTPDKQESVYMSMWVFKDSLILCVFCLFTPQIITDPVSETPSSSTLQA